MEEFKIIGFTTEDEWHSVRNEADEIISFLESGSIDVFHIRKKKASKQYTRTLIESITERLHNRLWLHSHYCLADEFYFGGIHGRDSFSCHSLQEIAQHQFCTYVFLSPIFDSISKHGYMSGFSLADHNMIEAVSHTPVIALGGVRPEYFKKIKAAKFAGAALLGYLWSPNMIKSEKMGSLLKAKSGL